MLQCPIRLYYMSFILLFIPILLFSETLPWEDGRSNGEQLRAKLVTFGPGDDIPSWWGHTAIIIEDLQYQKARIYNFGLYSFDDKMLARFVMGRLIFSGDDFKVPSYFNYYRKMNRSIRVASLHLTPKKRLQLAKILAKNVRPENKYYLYHHYYENCSTRLRDMIDQVLDGQFHEAAAKPARMSLRDHTRRYVGHNPFMEMLLMYLMNDDIDQPIERWHEMFLPDELERNVLTVSYRTDAGDTIKLGGTPQTIFKAERSAVPDEPYTHWPGALMTGLFTGGLAVLFTVWRRRSESIWPRSLFGIYHGLVGIVLGIPGLGLTLVASFTEHEVAYYNENLFFINLLTFLFLPLGIAFSGGKNWAERWLANLWYIHLLGAGLAVILKIVPAFDQDNALVMAFVFPVITGFALAWRLWFKLNRSAAPRFK